MVTGNKKAQVDGDAGVDIFDEEEWYFVEKDSEEEKCESFSSLIDDDDVDADGNDDGDGDDGDVDDDDVDDGDVVNDDDDDGGDDDVADYDDDDGVKSLQIPYFPPRSTVKSSSSMPPLICFSPERKIPPAIYIKDPIIQQILPYLPAKSLMRFRSVSKRWDRWIRSPILSHHQAQTHKPITGFFCQSHYSRPTFFTLDQSSCGIPSHSFSFLPDSTYLVASTHGLLVFLPHFGPDIYYICNPVTRAFRALPRPGLYHGLNSACVLAFDSAPENIESYYQLVCAVPLVGQPVVCFETYSSETGLWTRSNAVCTEIGPYEYFGTGLYMKGVAYWRTSGGKLVAFDTKFDVCEVLVLPEGSPVRGVLVEMEGEIAYVGICEVSGVGYVVKIYYGVEMRLVKEVKWCLENVGCFGGNYGVLPYYEKGRLLVMVGGMVYWCGMRDERFEKVVGCEVSESTVHHRIFPYVNSLVYLS
ncbi:F-box family protein [Striga asiatica]|uniref:F-box family protein n=1 Tax=Striga asiatica TaxID=4170 RepID=A0A5A7QRK6_STRAF|nr:F-box family protein [Striga asiatica]